MSPNEEIISNIQNLVTTCLQPLRDDLNSGIYISSGYRPPLLNRLIGGSPNSAHPDGRAADITAVGYTPIEVCRRIVELGLPYDQVIHEFGRWCHLGIAAIPRGEALTSYRLDDKTRYAWDVVPIAQLNKAVA